MPSILAHPAPKVDPLLDPRAQPADDLGVQDTEPDCRGCRHAFITYEASKPYGCRAFGFKSARWPHLVVRESSAEPCTAFEPKPTPKGQGQGSPPTRP